MGDLKKPHIYDTIEIEKSQKLSEENEENTIAMLRKYIDLFYKKQMEKEEEKEKERNGKISNV